jgi:hypothetical protein
MVEEEQSINSLPQYLGAQATEEVDPELARAGYEVAALVAQSGPERARRKQSLLPRERYIKSVVNTMVEAGCLPQVIGNFVAKQRGFK